MENSQ